MTLDPDLFIQISGIGFVGCFLTRILGARRDLGLTAAFVV